MLARAAGTAAMPEGAVSAGLHSAPKHRVPLRDLKGGSLSLYTHSSHRGWQVPLPRQHTGLSAWASRAASLARQQT